MSCPSKKHPNVWFRFLKRGKPTVDFIVLCRNHSCCVSMKLQRQQHQHLKDLFVLAFSTPKTWGFMIQFDEHRHSKWARNQPPTRKPINRTLRLRNFYSKTALATSFQVERPCPNDFKENVDLFFDTPRICQNMPVIPMVFNHHHHHHHHHFSPFHCQFTKNTHPRTIMKVENRSLIWN